MMTTLRGRTRIAAFTIVVTCAAILLAGCIEAPVTASGSGVVTVSWAGAAGRFNDTYGDVLVLCDESASQCGPDFPGSTLYRFYPDEGSTSSTLSAATPMFTAAGDPASPPAGPYVLQAVSYTNGTPAISPIGDLLHVVLGPPGSRDLTTWLQSVARPSAEASCARGYSPSWDLWPNDGTGGYVCNRTVYAYYPDEPVREPGWNSAAPEWLSSVGRDNAQTSCPAGYDPSWAHWPSSGAGGYVCNAQAS